MFPVILAASAMQPQKSEDSSQYVLVDTAKNMIIYNHSDRKQLQIGTAVSKTYNAVWIDPLTGKTIREQKIKLTAGKSIEKPVAGDVVLWLK